jgi:hypothetical protein
MTGPDPDHTSDPLPPPAPAAHWPGSVQRPGSPGFERSARAWLFDLAPPRFRYDEILHRRTTELARLVRLRLESDIAAMQTGLDALMKQPTNSHGEFADLADLYRRERDWAGEMLEQVKVVEKCLTAYVNKAEAPSRSPDGPARLARIPAQRRATG